MFPRPTAPPERGLPKATRHAERHSRDGALWAGRRSGVGRLGRVEADEASKAVVPNRESFKITKPETFVLKHSWVFVKISTNAGIVGPGRDAKGSGPDPCRRSEAG